MIFHKSIGPNKTIEAQFERWPNHDWPWFKINFEWTRCQDHAGFKFNIQLGKRYAHLWICDNRHWDYKTNFWEKISTTVSNRALFARQAQEGIKAKLFCCVPECDSVASWINHTDTEDQPFCNLHAHVEAHLANKVPHCWIEIEYL